jgi:hypothetical protein
MSHIRVLICRVDDPASDQMTELAAFDLPKTDVATLKPETALDELETTTQETGNAVLPSHNGIIITRGLQEWACLLPQELPFASVARLLGWQAHDDDLLSDTTIRSLVRRHGQIIRQAEQAEVAALAAHHDLTRLDLTLVPHGQPRWRALWSNELNTAVEAALAREQVRPPDGVLWTDWERGKRRTASGGDMSDRGASSPRATIGAEPGAAHGG